MIKNRIFGCIFQSFGIVTLHLNAGVTLITTEAAFLYVTEVIYPSSGRYRTLQHKKARADSHLINMLPCFFSVNINIQTLQHENKNFLSCIQKKPGTSTSLIIFLCSSSSICYFSSTFLL